MDIENLKKQIRKSGFPLEVNASVTLNKNNWVVFNNPRFINRQSAEWKEIDIVATKPSAVITNGQNLLIVECKKSADKPWIFFKQPTLKPDVFTLNIAGKREGQQYGLYEEQMAAHHYLSRTVCTYYTIGYRDQHDENSSKNQESPIYRAINQVINALGFYAKREDALMRKYSLKNVVFIYPIIVFDGKLLSATINGSDIDISEEQHVMLYTNIEIEDVEPVRWTPSISRFKRTKPVIIDVVHKDYFEKYLDFFK